jgi:hypothetical protein
MSKHSASTFIASVFSLGAAALGAYAFLIRPWHLRWGATGDEPERRLLGDELTPLAKLQTTHAVTIRAPASDVWAWLVQIGQGRGGFYSYEWIENLLGLNMHNIDRIAPELQDFHAADQVPLAPGGKTALPVDIIVPGESIVMHIENGDLTKFAVMQPGLFRNLTWSFHLRRVDEHTTRLIERLRADWDETWQNRLMVRGYFEPGAFIMQRGMLLGIKARAERAAHERERARASQA